MKNILKLIFVFFVTKAQAQEKTIDSFINKEILFKHVSFLAADSLKGRFSGSNEALIAAHYIANEFRKNNLYPIGDSTYFIKILNSKTSVGHNVMGYLNGHDSLKTNKLIIISAHYDHVGTIKSKINQIKPGKKGDIIYNGANDNATGVAAMMSIMSYLQFKKLHNYTLLFIAFTGEELGLLGSSAVAGNIKPKLIKTVFNLEMLGRKSDLGEHPYIVEKVDGSMLEKANEQLLKADTSFGKAFFRPDIYANENLFLRSDHFPFAQRGVEAFTIMLTSPQDVYYHSVDDEVETIDFEAFTKVVRAIALVIEKISQ